jgi:hypothetical protein
VIADLIVPLCYLWGVANVTATHWWQPGKPDKVLPGVLVEEEERGWVLHLDGSFDEPDLSALPKSGQPVKFPRKRPDSLPVLIGRSSQGVLISLIDCQVLEWSHTLVPSLSRGSLKLWPAVLAHGVHFENAEDFRFLSLSVRYSHLDTWTGTSGFTVKPGTTFYPLEIQYAKPESVDCTLSGGLKVSIEFSASGPTMPARTHLEITQQSWLTVTSTADLPFKKLLEHNMDLANLISLGVGEPLRPLEMSASCNAQDPSGATTLVSVELIHNRKPIAPISREVSYFDMLFTLPNVRDRFGELIAAWFERDDAFRSLCALYFGTMRSPFMYVEHRFLNMFQGLESFDRRTSQLPAEKLQKHEERLNAILGSVSNVKDRKWLKRVLRHSHEPSAADRIKHIVETLNASWLLTPNDIELSADFRNYYTHFDPKAETKLPPVEKRILTMHNLAVRLRVLSELVLLNAVGFSMDKVRELVKATRRLERHLSGASEPE